MTTPTIAANRARAENDPSLIVAAIPYATLLGIEPAFDVAPNVYKLPAKKALVGNPRLLALHGGALGGFMEMAASLHLLMTMETLKYPKVVDFSLDYLRAGLLKETYAACDLIREGRKLANVHVEAWQDDRSQLIARARVHFLLDN